MRYENIKTAKFISRPNRFIAMVEIDGKTEITHVKNTGRCRELLLAGADIFVSESDNPNRKTKYDLISVYKGERLINMDSSAPNKVFYEWVKQSGYFKNINKIKPEAKYSHSRFDFYIEADNRKIFVEVKGVTLEENNVAMFPDAPTQRGIKHINELCKWVLEGYEAYVVFIIQMKGILYFVPNDTMHKEFGDALRKAAQLGVKTLALQCDVSPNTISISDFVEVRL